MATTSKFVEIESVQKEPNKRISQTVTCITTTTTTMTKVINEPSIEPHADPDEVSCAQMPKILLYESTKDEENILTDDDTNSALSSIDSKELEGDLKEASPPMQDTIPNIDQIDTQMQNLSFISPVYRGGGGGGGGNATAKTDESVHHMSRQFDQLDLDGEKDGELDGEDPNDDKATKSGKSTFSGSVQTLSSNDTVDEELNQSENADKKDDSVIVLSDTDSEEEEDEEQPPKRNVSQEPPLKPTFTSSNDPAMYNISTIDSSTMQKVNNFFDNAPFVEPAGPDVTIEHSFNTSHRSQSDKEEIFVAETSDEESCNSVIDTSVTDKTGQQTDHKSKQKRINDDAESNQPEFSDNNITVDIPVIKSTSDQPRQLIRSQSGVKVKASHSSPIVKTASIDVDGLKRTSSNVIVRTPGSSIRVNSNNGQVNIAAKININIEIVEDSSEESSEDGIPPRKSQAIQSSEDCECSQYNNLNTNNVQSNDEVRKSSNSTSPGNSVDNARTPAKNGKLNAAKTPSKTPTKTPTTASKIKQFAFVPPKSMTKAKKIELKDAAEDNTKLSTKSIASESDGDENVFKVDKSIPVSPRDQELLVSGIHLFLVSTSRIDFELLNYSTKFTVMRGKRPKLFAAIQLLKGNKLIELL